MPFSEKRRLYSRMAQLLTLCYAQTPFKRSQFLESATLIYFFLSLKVVDTSEARNPDWPINRQPHLQTQLLRSVLHPHQYTAPGLPVNLLLYSSPISYLTEGKIMTYLFEQCYKNDCLSLLFLQVYRTCLFFLLQWKRLLWNYLVNGEEMMERIISWVNWLHVSTC